MKPCTALPILVLVTLAGACFGQTEEQRRCNAALAAMVSQTVATYQAGSTGRVEDPYRELIASLPPELRPHAVDSQNPKSLVAFESDIIALFDTAPELRNFEALQAKWGYTAEQLRDVLTYYATRIWDNRFDLVGSAPEVLQRLRDLSRAQYLTDPPEGDGPAKRYLYYLSDVTRRSIPEIARHLSTRLGRPVSEGQVYEELSDLRISIVDEFSRPLSVFSANSGANVLRLRGRPEQIALLTAGTSKLEIASALVRAGVPISVAAEALGFGEQALEFVLHHVGAIHRNLPWERIVLTADGRRLFETEYLVELRSDGYTTAETAALLNAAAGNPAVGSEHFRTESSVAARLKVLGLTVRRPHEEPDRYHPQYGYLKRHGKLVVETTVRFLLDNYRRPDDWLAEQLGVQVASLRDFLQRHSLVRVGTKPFQVTSATGARAAALQSRYAMQIEAVDKVVDFIQRTNHYPQQKDFGKDELEGLGDARFYGGGIYAIGGALENSGVFRSREEAVLAVYHRARSRSVPFVMRTLQWRGEPPLQIRAVNAREAIDEALDFGLKTGSFPKKPDYEAGRVLTPFPQLFGIGDFGPTLGTHSARFHDNYEEGLRAMVKRAEERGIRGPWHTISFRAPSSMPTWLLELTRQQIADDYLTLYQSLGRQPNSRDAVTGPLKLPVGWDRLFGSDTYREGKPQRKNAIFPDRSFGLEFIAKRARARGVSYSVLDIEWMIGKPTALMQTFRQEEAVDRYINWVTKNGSHPLPGDFAMQPDKVQLTYASFFATGEYGAGGAQADAAIFSNKDATRAAIVARAKARGLSLPPFRD